MEELLKELEEAKQKIAGIEKKIEEKKTETGRWKPKEGDKYWLINAAGWICNSQWDDDDTDRERYLVGNCYPTEEECKFAREKLKVIAELKEYAEPKSRAWNGENVRYHIYYNYDVEKVYISWAQMAKQNEIYFESEEKARQAIDAIGEQRIAKFYLGVDLNE